MVSIVIPAYNAAKNLPDLLQSINRQSVEKEVVIIDSSSSDDTVRIAESAGATVWSIRKEDFGHGRTRNLAASKAKGEILVFLTQDALLVDDDAVSVLVESLKGEGVGAAYGRQIARTGAKPTEKYARSYNYPDEPSMKSSADIARYGIKTFFFSNVFSAVRKDVFFEMGGFPENLYMFEDMLFAARLIRNGYKIAYVPESSVIHSHNLSLTGQFRRYALAGASFAQSDFFSQYAKGTREGKDFFINELKYLQKERQYIWLPYAFAETFMKYCGYRLGLKYEKLPNRLKETIFE